MNQLKIILLAIVCSPRILGWTHSQQRPFLRLHSTRLRDKAHSQIDLQSDKERFGRGEMHLSALLEEKDIVVFQSGSWSVDGVLVGDGPVKYEYCMVESLQVVWTHNCEHGVVRGYSVFPGKDGIFQVDSTWDPIEFGPEQLLARLPVSWVNETTCKLCVPWKNLSQELQDL